MLRAEELSLLLSTGIIRGKCENNNAKKNNTPTNINLKLTKLTAYFQVNTNDILLGETPRLPIPRIYKSDK